MNRQENNPEFDYIIIGAGSAGCVVANRLVRRGFKVLLLEAGRDDNNLFIHIPIGYYKTIFNKNLSWNYWTEEIPTLGNRRMFWPRGKVLGGCSSVNGLVYIQGQPEDYNGWEMEGNLGWSWHSLQPYFKEIQKNSYFLHERVDGFAFSKIVEPHPLSEKFIESCKNLGIKINSDFNQERQEGSGYFNLTVKNGRRYSSSTAFIKPIKKKPNFNLSLNSCVSKILFDSSKKRAVGVEYYKNNSLLKATSRREIILCAGAINSPKILQLSGVGEAKYLKKMGIEIVKNLPGVGGNLQDHYQARLIYTTKNIKSLNILSRKISWNLKTIMQYILNRSGPLAIGAAQAGAFIKSSPSLSTPDLQIHFIPLSVDVPGKTLHSFSGITASVCQLRPKSRGYVKISSPDFLAPPLIQPNYFSHPYDMVTTIRGIDICRDIFKQVPILNYIDTEFEPGILCQESKDLVDFIKQRGTTIFHPVGSCKMGIDKNAVVDSRLKIHGLEGIRVVDASIMPTLVSGNTNAAAVVIGMKGSDLILADEKSSY